MGHAQQDPPVDQKNDECKVWKYVKIVNRSKENRGSVERQKIFVGVIKNGHS